MRLVPLEPGRHGRAVGPGLQLLTRPRQPAGLPPLRAHRWPSSIVLTEDDYLDFLVQTSTDNLIPHRIQATFVGQMLLLGYQFSDLGFRCPAQLVSIQREMQRGKTRKRHLSVQMVTAGEVPTPLQIEERPDVPEPVL